MAVKSPPQQGLPPASLRILLRAGPFAELGGRRAKASSSAPLFGALPGSQGTEGGAEGSRATRAVPRGMNLVQGMAGGSMSEKLRAKPGEGSIVTMGWQPKLTKILPAAGSRPRPWVLIAEEHAPAAVQLLLNIMNGNYPIKVRMEAATKVLMIAGTGFRGEARDASGRPASNGTFRLTGGGAGSSINSSSIANRELLRAALATLPPGAVREGPEQVEAGEKVVMLHNPKYSKMTRAKEMPFGGVFRGKQTPGVNFPQHAEVELELDEQDDLEEEAGYF